MSDQGRIEALTTTHYDSIAPTELQESLASVKRFNAILERVLKQEGMDDYIKNIKRNLDFEDYSR